MLHIGAFADLAGVSAKQLRAYDALGVFRPAWVEPASSYRFYSPAQLPDLHRILALRQLGMPLEEIRAVTAGGDLRDALRRRREALENDRRRAEERLAALEISVAAEGDVDVVVRPIGPEHVAVMALHDHPDTTFHRLETHVHRLGRRAHRPPGAIPSAGEIFVPVTGPIPSTDGIAYRRLPPARVASILHRGPYDGIAGARRTLERWAAAAAMTPDGPLRVLYLQFGAEPDLRLPAGYVVAHSKEFVTELQLPVA